MAAMVALAGVVSLPRAQPAEAPSPALSRREAERLWKQLAAVPNPGPLPSNAGPVAIQDARSQAGGFADLARTFHQTFPTHAKAPEAIRLERVWLERAIALGDSNRVVQLQLNPLRTEDETFHSRLNEFHKRALLKGGSNPAAVMAEMERQARGLMKEDPSKPESYHLLMTVAQNSHTNKMAALFRELSGSKAAPEDLRRSAAAQLRDLEKIGHPFELEFKDVRGRDFNLTNALGRNVILAFFRAAIPPELNAIREVRKQVEMEAGPDKKQAPMLLGVSLDEQLDLLGQVIAEEKWDFPIHCDGRGWGNAVSLKHNIMRTPTLFLIDRKGILRFMDGQEDLSSKLRMLEWEK
jgi:peroxiredoxin